MSARELDIVEDRVGQYWIADIIGYIDGPFSSIKHAERVLAEWIAIEDEEAEDDD